MWRHRFNCHARYDATSTQLATESACCILTTCLKRNAHADRDFLQIYMKMHDIEIILCLNVNVLYVHKYKSKQIDVKWP